MSKNSFWFVLSSASAAAVAGAPQLAGAVCTCTLNDLIPQIVKTMGPTSFQYLGSPSAGYDVELATDNRWGFKNSVSPDVYFDYKVYAGNFNVTTSAQVCRLSYTGTYLACAPTSTQVLNPNGSTLSAEMGVSVAGTFNANNSIWDRYLMRVLNPGASLFTPQTVPIVARSW